MVFYSILFPGSEGSMREETPAEPSFFGDLNLDQIVNAITANKEEYNLKPFFYTPLKDVASIKYRQEVMGDLENPSLFEEIRAFEKRMRTMREHLARADKLYYKYEKGRWFLEAVRVYCNAVSELLRALSRESLISTGLVAFREYLRHYVNSDQFTSLLPETENLKADLASVRYCLLIRGDRVTVRKYESEIDYSADVEQTFAKFKQ